MFHPWSQVCTVELWEASQLRWEPFLETDARLLLPNLLRTVLCVNGLCSLFMDQKLVSDLPELPSVLYLLDDLDAMLDPNMIGMSWLGQRPEKWPEEHWKANSKWILTDFHQTSDFDDYINHSKNQVQQRTNGKTNWNIAELTKTVSEFQVSAAFSFLQSSLKSPWFWALAILGLVWKLQIPRVHHGPNVSCKANHAGRWICSSFDRVAKPDGGRPSHTALMSRSWSSLWRCQAPLDGWLAQAMSCRAARTGSMTDHDHDVDVDNVDRRWMPWQDARMFAERELSSLQQRMRNSRAQTAYTMQHNRQSGELGEGIQGCPGISIADDSEISIMDTGFREPRFDFPTEFLTGPHRPHRQQSQRWTARWRSMQDLLRQCSLDAISFASETRWISLVASLGEKNNHIYNQN